jgi:hypothetical protein
VAKTDAGKYLEDLIRAQIDVYTSSPIGRPDEADTEKVRDALRNVWNVYRDKLQLGAGVDGIYPPSSEFKVSRAARDELQITKMVGGTNELVAKMGAWQDVLGFPLPARPYHLLWPTPPNPDRDLRKLTGPWQWRLVDTSTAADLARKELDRPGQVYNNAPVEAVTPVPGRESFLGLSKNGMLLYKRSSDASWKRAPNSNAFVAEGLKRDTFALENIGFSRTEGTLLGTPRNPDELQRPAKEPPNMKWVLGKMPGPVWSYSDPDKLP